MMRERRRLEAAIGTVNDDRRRDGRRGRIRRAGRGRGRRGGRSRRAGNASPRSPTAPMPTRSRRCSRARPTATTPISKSMPARAAPKARTGPRCSSGCTPAGPNAAATRSSWSITMRAKQAGIKSATLLIKGENAYGYAKTESGVHRLVRISPYDSSARRHTSFSSVWVYPVIDDNIDIEINPATSRSTPTARAGRAGSTSTPPIRRCGITHVPSGIIVASQNDRSQHKNRATAMSMLKARLVRGRDAPGARPSRERRVRSQDRDRLGPPDPQLRPAAVPDGQGPAHRRTPRPRPTTCSTARSTPSSPPRCRSG